MLWIPELNKIVDPTVYQVNRTHTPTKITRALMFSVRDLNDLSECVIKKDGADIQYAQVHDADLSWFDKDINAREGRQTAEMTRKVIDGVDELMRSPEARDAAWPRTATFPPLVRALADRGLI